ncbi:MAG: M23 family metallopeptidase [Patescibacteria group bacterium]
MKNQIWGYIRYLLLGIVTATALLWSITVAPAVASAAVRHPELDSGSLAQIPGSILRSASYGGLTQARNDGEKGLVLSLPFSVDSRWTSVDNNTPGIAWKSSPPLTPPPTGGEIDSSSPAKGRLGGDSIKFGVQDGQFIPGDAENDTWFVYGWFGALQAIKQSYNVKYPEWGDRHDGIDFAGQEGIEVTSASAGTVIFAGKKIGNTVIVNAGNGYQITYGHLQDISVKKGQKVKIGTLIGHLGKTGTTNPHLHFEVDYIKKGARIAINPVPLLDTEWGNVIIPDAEANQFYTENQDPLTQPDFSW